jgi:rRNA pseudouridine-1189 N-methylase Emg1 (Nep1/Mra1 family)
MEEKKVRFTTYLPESSKEAIVRLSEDTRIPQARLFEEAVEELLKKYNIERNSKR